MDEENAPPTSDKLQEAQEQELILLATILDTPARDRLSRIALVDPERAKQLRDILLRMAQSGQLRQRVSEDQLINLIVQFEEEKGAPEKKPVVFYRRKGDDFDLDDI